MIIRELGRVDYQSSWDAMRAFTDARTPDSEDELWVCEHNPVFTQGIAGRPEHLLINPAAIPIVQTDRGGQITYHGPGQAMVYLLFNLKRSGYGVRELVIRVENAVIAVLAQHGIEAYGKRDAPGVYVRLPVAATPTSPQHQQPQHQQPQQQKPQQRAAGPEAKIAALGLKIRNGHSYHGVAFNVNMDLTPFSFINPCGYEGLQVTHLHDLGVGLTVSEAGAALARELERELLAPAQVRK